MGPLRLELSSFSLQKTAARQLTRLLASFICLPFAGQVGFAGAQDIGKAADGGAQTNCPRCFNQSAPTAFADENARPGRGPGDFAAATRFHLVQDAALSFFVEDIAAVAGTAVPVRIRLPSPADELAAATASRRFLIFRGLPDALTLSAGFRTRTIWIVPAAEAGNLKLHIPPTYQGSLTLVVLLDRGDTGNPEKRTVTVRISPPPTVAVAAPASPATEPAARPPQTPQPHAAPSSAKAEEDMLVRGRNHLRNGNIVFARVLFEELAARGSAQGAFAMAQTFDPDVLEQLHVVGVQADLEKAKYWYRKAAELGKSPPTDILGSLKKERPQE